MPEATVRKELVSGGKQPAPSQLTNGQTHALTQLVDPLRGTPTHPTTRTSWRHCVVLVLSTLSERGKDGSGGEREGGREEGTGISLN